MRPAKLWNKRFVQLVLIESLFQFGAYLTNPIVSGYAVALGSTLAVGGILAGLSASMALAARPLTGWLADRIAKKSFLVIAAVLFCISAFGCAFSTSAVLIGVFRIIAGFAFAFRSAAVIALVSLSVPTDRLGTAVGWTGIAQTVSCALGPVAGAMLMGVASYWGSFVAAGVLFAAGLLLCLAFREPEGAQGVRSSCKAFGGSRRLHLSGFFYGPNARIALVAGLSIVPHGVAITFILMAGEMRGIAGASIYFGVYAVTALVAKPLAGRLTDALDTRCVVIPAFLIEVAATVLLACMVSLPWVLAAACCMGLGQASAYSALQAEAVRGVPVHELGRASNTFYVGTDAGMGFGPMLAGAVLQIAGITAMFLLAGMLVLVALVILLMYHSSIPKG